MAQVNRQAQAKELQEKIATEIEGLRDSEQWQRLLEFRKNVPYSYSLNNLILIWSQCSEASVVAGYRKWQANGRQVNKGEKAIKIFGFSKKKVGESEEKDESGKNKPIYQTFFPVLSVFDISQTSAIDKDKDVVRDLEETSPSPLSGEDEYGVLDTFSSVAESLKFSVRYGDTGKAHGYTRFSDREIVLSEKDEPAMQAKVLLHEIGHAVLHENVDYHGHRGLYETEAESVAYVLAGILGIDTTNYSISYVAGWSSLGTETIKKSAENVLRATDKVLAIVDKLKENEENLVAA